MNVFYRIVKGFANFFDQLDRAKAASDYVNSVARPDHSLLVQFTKNIKR